MWRGLRNARGGADSSAPRRRCRLSLQLRAPCLQSHPHRRWPTSSHRIPSPPAMLYGEQGFWLGRRNERVEAETRAHGTGSCARSAAPCRPCAQKAQIRALKCRWVSLGVTWGVPRGALDIVAGQPPPHFFRGAGIAPGGPGRLGHETRQGSLHVALKSVLVRPELGDLNVIIQVEEWHSSDRIGGTVRARESGHLGPKSVVRCRFFQPQYLVGPQGPPGDTQRHFRARIWADRGARTVPCNLSELCHSSTCMMTFRSHAIETQLSTRSARALGLTQPRP